jgi:hypothetical protein
VERHQRQDPRVCRLVRHRVVHLPVLVAHRRRRRARVVEEDIAS